MRHRRRFVLALVWTCTLATLTAQRQDACECYSERPPICEAYWKYDAAFVGRVVSAPILNGMGPSRVLVERAWKGVKTGEVKMNQGGTVIHCGGVVPFPTGSHFLFLANRDDEGLLKIGSCDSRHWQMGTAEADEAIASLDGLDKPSPGARVYGEVSLVIPTFEELGEPRRRPLEGAVVHLTGPGQLRTAPVVNGRYEMTGLQPGTYDISVAVPEDMPQAFSARVPEGHRAPEAFYDPDYVPARVRSITIPDLHACSHSPFAAAFDGGITGTVLKADKTPAEDITVEALPVGIDPLRQQFAAAEAITDKDGRYRIGGLMAGRYIVGVNVRDVLTGDVPYAAVMHRVDGVDGPAIVTLDANGQVDLPPLRLPAETPTREIHGVLKVEDGSSADDIQIDLREADREHQSIDRLQGHGAIATAVYVHWDDHRHPEGFSGRAFEGRTYVISATRFDPRGLDAQGACTRLSRSRS
jgi:hypothetical protein